MQTPGNASESAVSRSTTDAIPLVRPAVDERQAAELALRHFGLEAEAVELGSNQDRNFLLTSGDGRRHVLKFDNAAFGEAELRSQNQAVGLFASGAVGAEVSAARVLPGLDGHTLQLATGAGDTVRHLRLFEFVEGGTLVDAGYLGDATLAGLGSLAASVSLTLEKFEHPGLERELQWDLRRGFGVVQRLLPAITDGAKARAVAAAAESARALLAPLGDALRVQPLHGDLTDDNIVGFRIDPESGRARGTVIDFGDLGHGWRVAELAVLCSSLLHHRPDQPLSVLAAAAAFHRENPLSEAEARALWPLLVLRAAVLIASGWEQVGLEADNDYAAERMDHEWTIFESATAMPLEVGTEAVLAALGFPRQGTGANPETAAAPIATLDGHAVLDLGVESPLLDEGRWTRPGIEAELLSAALEEHPVVLLPCGRARLTRTVRDSAEPGATIPLALQLYTREPLGFTAPWDGRMLTAADGAEHRVEVVSGSGERMVLTGVLPEGDSREVARGEFIARVPAELAGSGALPIPVCLQRIGAGAPAEVPLFTTPDLAPAWLRLALDPAALLGLKPAVPEPDPHTEQDRRNAVLSPAQERFFEDPPQFERGWRHHLVDTAGRAYVDLVNNVTSIGHGHPAVADAAAAQLRLLNTNSRFLYRALADYSRRLVELAPEGSGLDTVLLVNSGSEAVELGLKLARAATGRDTVVALREAYHGWSMAADAVTTSAFDNPHAGDSRPDWVELLEVPHPLRGSHTGPDAGSAYAADAAARIAELGAAGTPVGAFIAEPVLGNAGGVLLPDGYLDGVYRAVRAAGGVCIADEVQVGFGRMGRQWAFELQGAVPDIVTIAKPMGNGFPLGGVLTTRRIAESLVNEGQFFSSTGGSPAACRVGIAVLDVLRDEKLMGNAAAMGEYLHRRLAELATRHPLIGHVHGTGLFLGIELVKPGTANEPAVEETMLACERLLGLGIITQPTSERRNVLKIKPPLCLTRESADFVVQALDRVLAG